jgi:pantoate kinase
MRARAFCPGHITGFFEIRRVADPLATGSRGAGMCLSLGAKSEVTVSESTSQSITVMIDGKTSPSEVTKAALRRMLGNARLNVVAKTSLDLPQSQGFGMSAAGTLSASIALADVLGMSRRDAYEAAHIAEVECNSGLGDISAIYRGGVTVRVKPGLPPIGKVLRIDGTPEVVLAVLGRRLLTRSVLRDPGKRRSINLFGGRCVDAILAKPTLSNLMELSQEFALNSGLASKRVQAAMAAAQEHGRASMSMLGNSVFAVGSVQHLRKTIKEFGDTWVCKVDTAGPMML